MVRLFFAELKREWIIRRRYGIETLSSLLGLTIIFYGLFQSAQYLAGPGAQLGTRLDSIIVGYVLWSLSLFVVSDTAGTLQQEALTGTLEQIFLSPVSASLIFVTRAVANLVVQLVLNFTILLLIMAITGSHLSFPPTLLLPLFAVLLGAYGLALAIGSAALILKRIQQILQIFNFLLFFLLLVPTENWVGFAKPLSWFLPMTLAAGLLRDVMARGEVLDLVQFLVALINGCGYFALGLYLFHFAEREAKRRGKLGGY